MGAFLGLLLIAIGGVWAWARSVGFGAGGGEDRVTAVLDGDTVDIWREGRRWRIRLHGVDTPERSQAWGEEARAVLRELVEGRRVKLRIHGTDVYGRVLGELSLPDGRSVEEELLRRGAAWCYRRAFSPDDDEKERARGELFLRLEAEARKARRGLWGRETPPESPWDWRHRQRTGAGS